MSDLTLTAEKRTQFGKGVVDLLVFGQTVTELGQHARGERDVSCLDLDTSRGGEGFDDRFERVSRQKRCFIRARVNDFSHSDGLLRIFLGSVAFILPSGLFQ